MNFKSVSFEYQTAKRIIENSQWVDKRPRSEVKPDNAPINWGGLTALVLTETLPAGSGLTPGKGKGKIQQFDGTTFSDAQATDPTSYPILNTLDKTVNSGSLVLCGPAYGYFFAVVIQCEAIPS